MGKVRKNFEIKGMDEKKYQGYFHQNQSEYIRKRLRVVKMYHEGAKIKQISQALGIHPISIHKYVNDYLSGGFEMLCKGITRPQKSRIDTAQFIELKKVILEKKPFDAGLEGNIWTGALIRSYIERTYGVVYKSGVYDLLWRMGLTHQKAHADYGNADKNEQESFLKLLKDKILLADISDGERAAIKFDEFSLCEKPTPYYGWAAKNTRPKTVTDEKKAKGRTGC